MCSTCMIESSQQGRGKKRANPLDRKREGERQERGRTSLPVSASSKALRGPAWAGLCELREGKESRAVGFETNGIQQRLAASDLLHAG
jgi:hypothetical protein